MKDRRLLAGGVTTLGVLAIWAVASMRQEDQTVALGRAWVGEQWDVARRCVVGTPIGRRGSERALADRLAAMAIDTLAELDAAEAAPEPARLWPARCAPLFDGLRVDAAVTGADLSRHVAELDALARHALAPRDAAGTIARARALAGPIHALDRAMPPGAEYDPTHFPPPRADPAPIEASLACRAPIPTSRCAALALDAAPPALVRGGAAIPLSPAPPGDEVVSTCDDARALVLWRDGARWAGTRCEASCAAAPPLEAGEDLQLAITPRGVVAIAPGRHTDLPLARTLGADGWSAPVPVPRGRLEGAAITFCEDRWTFGPR